MIPLIEEQVDRQRSRKTSSLPSVPRAHLEGPKTGTERSRQLPTILHWATHIWTFLMRIMKVASGTTSHSSLLNDCRPSRPSFDLPSLQTFFRFRPFSQTITYHALNTGNACCLLARLDRAMAMGTADPRLRQVSPRDYFRAGRRGAGYHDNYDEGVAAAEKGWHGLRYWRHRLYQ